MFFGVPRGPILQYAHRAIDKNKFIFPITGLKIAINSIVTIGLIDFVDKEYLVKNVIDSSLAINHEFNKNFKLVSTFAVVDLKRYGNYKGLCRDGNNSLALQLLKQTIGGIYLSIFNKTTNVDCEKRIVISNKGIHEVDEGLNPYMAIHDNKSEIYPNTVDEMLIATTSNFDITNIPNVIKILNKPLKEKNEYEKKICKVLEVIYSNFNECYSRERVLKWAIILNYIFRGDNSQKIESTDIGRKLRIIFNVIEKKEILEQLPKRITSEVKKTKKISDIMIDIYSRIRNDLMHGKIDYYTEYAICDAKDIIILKVVVMELLNIMVKDEYLSSCTSTNEFNNYVEKKETENIEAHKSSR
ncbi:hypothetical protein AXY43_16505 [Clostridium sp. MF28]|uniref:hypothetical protein n=1 Tax=Clostridium TaxID=1485 RepID=UPI000CF8EBD8|nr:MULTISPECIES: hypothetical protein [Clostridium]AVK49452.1 hypothetical protein AXY43_16505 [Clostridium sp. MF28]PSM55403.1 hypothetical protein C4L39_23155 [Clostridium diolis]